MPLKAETHVGLRAFPPLVKAAIKPLFATILPET